MKKLALLVFLFSFALYAQEEGPKTFDEAQALIEKYTEEEQALKGQVESLKSQTETFMNEVAELERKIEELKAEIERLKQELEEKSWYVVKPGDWLSKLAEYPDVYGHGNYRRWRDIYNANKHLIKDPNLIYPGWKLRIPRP